MPAALLFLASFAGPAGASTSTFTPVADSYIKFGTPNKNQGTQATLSIQDAGNHRVLIRFDQAQIAAAVGSSQVSSARLRLQISGSAAAWGATGRGVAIHRMTNGWTETGVTWNCPNDSNVGNSSPDCTQWAMGNSSQWPFLEAPTSVVLHVNGQTGMVEFDVTADVQAYIATGLANHGWLIKKANESISGRVDYFSRESAQKPELVIETGPPPSPTIQVYDTYLREGVPNQSAGSEVTLQVRDSGNHRALVRFDQQGILATVGSGTLASAKLRLEVVYNANNWSAAGRDVAVHRMSGAWDEPGATWNCADDNNTQNAAPDCPGNAWALSTPAQWPFAATPTATVVQKNNQVGMVEWDVTADVHAFLSGAANYGWLVKKVDETKPGFVRYASHEGTHPPQLVLIVTGGGVHDTDGDGVPDDRDAFPSDPTEWSDLDGDGRGDNSDPDIDGDGFDNANDVFPFDPLEHADLDGDGVGDNSDRDRDGDGFENGEDVFPNDPTEWADLDTDGFGDNSDIDIDGDGVLNVLDAFPRDPTESADLDGDGIGDNGDPDRDNDGYPNAQDAFPNDPTEWSDIDHDGTGDNADVDRDNDGYPNAQDAFPNDPTEWADRDGDGIGDNKDQDRDGDGQPNDVDVFPDDPNRWKLPVISITSPASLTTVGTTPITVIGTLDDPQAVLTVNGSPVTVVNGRFETLVNLTEGFNDIVARAIDRFGSEGTGSVVITLDATPPYITVQSPQDGATVNTPLIAVNGLINDIVRGTVSDVQSRVTVNGITASVVNRSYLAQNVPLQLGSNTLTISAADAVGNTETKTIHVTYEPPVGAHIQLVAGQNQRARITQLLPQPLSVRLVNETGVPVPGKSVVFRVVQGDGKVGAGLPSDEQAAAVGTDAQGVATVRFALGTRAGAGNHRVRASAVGFDSEVIFEASADTNPGDKISVIAGNNQRGAMRNPLPAPFIVAVTDTGGNLVADAPVEFKVVAGGGVFANGEPVYTTATDTDGRATAILTLGPAIGYDVQRVVATLATTIATAGFTASSLVPGDSGQTRISGVVLDNQDRPVPRATLRIEGTTREAQADAQGLFTITQVPVGPVRLLVDGSTTTLAGEWPTLSFDLVTVAGADNSLPAPIYLVPLNTESAMTVGDEDTTLTLPEVPGFSLLVKAGSVTFPDGSRDGRVSVTVVNNDKIPMAPPNGMQPQFIVTIQPAGAKFDPPAELTIPNVDGHSPGAEVELYSYDHDLEEFVTIGWGTVSADGRVIRSNPGVGVVKAGWHCGSQPGGSGCCTGSGGGNGGCAQCYKRENDQCTDECVPDDSQSCEKSDPTNKCVTGECRGGACADVPVADGTSCYDPDAQLNQCRIYECRNGACDNSRLVADGTNCDPYDDNECTTGVCQQGECLVVPVTPPAQCDPGGDNPCLTGQCQGTSCVAEPVSDGAFCELAGDNPCQVGSCQNGVCAANNVPNGTSCNAGTVDACTVGGSCQNGSCVQGEQISCDDGNECTEDLCHPVTGCTNTPLTNGGCCSGFAFHPATQGCCDGVIYELGALCCIEPSQCQ